MTLSKAQMEVLQRMASQAEDVKFVRGDLGLVSGGTMAGLCSRKLIRKEWLTPAGAAYAWVLTPTGRTAAQAQEEKAL